MADENVIKTSPRSIVPIKPVVFFMVTMGLLAVIIGKYTESVVALILHPLSFVAAIFYMFRGSNQRVWAYYAKRISAEKKAGTYSTRYRRLFDNSPDIHFVIREDYAIEEVNGMIQKVLGYTIKDVVDGPIFMVIHPADSVRMKGMIDLAFKKQPVEGGVTIRLLSKDKRDVECDIRMHLLDGEFYVRLTVACRDISQQVANKKTIEEESGIRSTIFENTGDAILIVDQVSSKVLSANGRACELYGYTPDEILNVKPSALLCDGRQYKVETGTATHKTKNGDPIHVDVKAFGVRFCGCSASLLIVSGAGCKAGRENLSGIIEELDAIVYNIDRNLIVKSVNGAIERLLGYKVEEIVGRSLYEIMSPEAIAAFKADHAIRLSRIPHSGTRYTSRVSLVKKGGGVVHLEFRSNARIGPKNNILGFYGVAIDITSKMEADVKRRHSKYNLMEDLDAATTNLFTIGLKRFSGERHV